MYLVLLIVAIIVCILLAVIVLVQNPKGGGLASNFSSSSQLLGVQKTGDILEKGTWVLAISLMVLSLAVNVAVKSGATSGGSNDQMEQIQKASKPTSTTGAAAPTLPGASTPARATAPAAAPDTAKK